MTAGTNRLLLQDGRKFWLNDCEAVLGIMSGLLIIGGLNVFSSSFVMAEMNTYFAGFSAVYWHDDQWRPALAPAGGDSVSAGRIC